MAGYAEGDALVGTYYDFDGEIVEVYEDSEQPKMRKSGRQVNVVMKDNNNDQKEQSTAGLYNLRRGLQKAAVSLFAFSTVMLTNVDSAQSIVSLTDIVTRESKIQAVLQKQLNTQRLIDS